MFYAMTKLVSHTKLFECLYLYFDQLIYNVPWLSLIHLEISAVKIGFFTLNISSQKNEKRWGILKVQGQTNQPLAILTIVATKSKKCWEKSVST